MIEVITNPELAERGGRRIVIGEHQLELAAQYEWVGHDARVREAERFHARFAGAALGAEAVAITDAGFGTGTRRALTAAAIRPGLPVAERVIEAMQRIDDWLRIFAF